MEPCIVDRSGKRYIVYKPSEDKFLLFKDMREFLKMVKEFQPDFNQKEFLTKFLETKTPTINIMRKMLRGGLRGSYIVNHIGNFFIGRRYYANMEEDIVN